MRFAHAVLILVLSLASAQVSAQSADSTAARAFFARYVALGEAYDDRVGSLYSDSAVIRTHRRYPHGLERALELSGSQWKALLKKVMPLAKAQGDRSRFSNIRVSTADARATIKADRYSVRKCYTDTGYYMLVERQPSGAYLIVEEYSETQPKSSC